MRSTCWYCAQTQGEVPDRQHTLLAMIQNEVTQRIVQLNVLDILQHPTTTQVEVKSLFKFNGPLSLF